MQPIQRHHFGTFFRLQFAGKWTLVVISIFAIVIMAASNARAAQVARPAPPAPAPSPAAREFQFVKSTFANTPPGIGKDPFFPRSTRLVQVKITPVETTGALNTALRVNGISGPKNRRLAIINYRTFETNEEADLKVGGQTVRVRCLEIRDDGVTVSVNGQTQKLLLGAKP